MDLIVIDFETHYTQSYSLRKLTTEQYIRDQRFELIGFAMKVNDGATEWFTGSDEHLKRILDEVNWKRSMLLAHNTIFDAGILSFRYGIHPKKLLDTMCMGRAWLGVDTSVSLANMANHYGVGQKGDEVLNALGKRRADFTVDEMARYGQYCVNDVDLTYKIFNILMQEERFPVKELGLIDLTLKMFTKPHLILDATLLEKHLQNVRTSKLEHMVNALMAIGEFESAAMVMLEGEAMTLAQKLLRSNDLFANALRTVGVEPPTKVSPTTGKTTWAFAKTDDGFRALQEHEDDRVQVLARARVGVKTTLEESRTGRFIEMAKRGPIPIPLKYAGARTARWAGMDNVNLQNLPSRGDNTLKRAITAPDGYVVVGADLSNIELRVGLWLAGQMGQLQKLGSGLDLYKDFASQVFDVAYDDVTKDQRFIGKTSQLSLIYGVGANKLRQAIKVGSGTDIGEAEAVRIVNLYRTQYNDVKSTWDDGEDALKCIVHNNTRSYGHNNLISIQGSKGCLMPSGLYMRYPGLTQETERNRKHWVYHTRKGKEHLYGAKFFQGLVQGIARCVMGEQMLNICKKYPILLTVHDAVYILAKATEAETAMQYVLDCMRTAPEWIPEIPLDAEAAYGKTLADC